MNTVKKHETYVHHLLQTITIQKKSTAKYLPCKKSNTLLFEAIERLCMMKDYNSKGFPRVVMSLLLSYVTIKNLLI